MKWLVCGGRDYADTGGLRKQLDALAEDLGSPSIVIHGAARGADTLASEWAAARGYHDAAVPARWDFHGNRVAGILRNRAMLLLQPDLVIAFPGGRGTDHMIKLAEKAALRVILCE